MPLVFPTLKKPNLDPDLCQNYRPISNLSFLSKTLERLVSFQLLPYIEQQDFFLLVSLDLGLITQLKPSISPFCLTSTLLSIDPNLCCWLYMMFQPLLTW